MQGVLVGKLVGATFVAAYAVKYGQLATGLGFEPSAPAALAMVLVPPVNLLYWYKSACFNSTKVQILTPEASAPAALAMVLVPPISGLRDLSYYHI